MIKKSTFWTQKWRWMEDEFPFQLGKFLVNHVNWVVDFARKKSPPNKRKPPQQTAVAHLLEDSMLVAAQNDRSFTAHGLVHLKLFLPMNPLRLLAPRKKSWQGNFHGMSLRMYHSLYGIFTYIGLGFFLSKLGLPNKAKSYVEVTLPSSPWIMMIDKRLSLWNRFLSRWRS